MNCSVDLIYSDSHGVANNLPRAGRFLVHQLAGSTQPLTDHGEAIAIKLSVGEHQSNGESSFTNSSSLVEGAGATESTVLAHYDAQENNAVGNVDGIACSVQRSVSECSESAAGSTYVLSHYTECYTTDRRFVEVNEGSSDALTRLSHLPTSGCSAASGAAGGPPPLEHLPNYCTITVSNLNSSTNKVTHSVPPPLLGVASVPVLECLSNVQAPAAHLAANVSGSQLMTVVPPSPPPLQLIPLAPQTLLKLEPPISSLTRVDGGGVTALWSTRTNTETECPPTSVELSSPCSGMCGTYTPSPSSPPPLAHPHPGFSASDMQATISSASPFPTASHPPTQSIVLCGPPQGIHATLVLV